MSDIFISYARKDRDRVQPLADALEQRGWSVWWDRRIRTSEIWDEVIEKALDTTKSVVVVWTKTSVKSQWVKNEAREGLKRSALFPVMLCEEAQIPLEFRHVQAAWLTDWQFGKSHSGFDQFMEDIARVVALRLVYGAPQTPLKQSKVQLLSEMVRVPKGPFLYGKTRDREAIDHDFWIDRYPVTNEQFRKFILENGYGSKAYWSPKGWKWRVESDITVPKYWNDSKWNKADHPVVGVSYYEAEAYAKWAGKRLPSEREWEKAARSQDGRIYPWGDEFDKTKCNSPKLWTAQILTARTTPVTQYPAGVSPYGCYDMAGNVWEWCADRYEAEEPDAHGLRGGSWFHGPVELGSSDRWWGGANRTNDLGFRLVKEIVE